MVNQRDHLAPQQDCGTLNTNVSLMIWEEDVSSTWERPLWIKESRKLWRPTTALKLMPIRSINVKLTMEDLQSPPTNKPSTSHPSVAVTSSEDPPSSRVSTATLLRDRNHLKTTSAEFKLSPTPTTMRGRIFSTRARALLTLPKSLSLLATKLKDPSSLPSINSTR